MSTTCFDTAYPERSKTATPDKNMWETERRVMGDGHASIKGSDQAKESSDYLNKRIRTRSVSPNQYPHSTLIRPSVVKLQNFKKAKRVMMYRNGDKFFQGMVYAVSADRFKTFDALLTDLSKSCLCDKTVLTHGVRTIFTLDGCKKITTIEDLEDGESYVCASGNVFRQIDYPKNDVCIWNYSNLCPVQGSYNKKITIENDERAFIWPKLITVIRNGFKPRKAVRVLLNKKTAYSLDQVFNYIQSVVQPRSGYLRKIFTIEGKQVLTLSDFFGDETTFLAYGPEKMCSEDFDIDKDEVHYVGAYTSRPKERITLKSVGRCELTQTTSEGGIFSQNRGGKIARASHGKIMTKTNSNIEKESSENIPPPELSGRYRVGKIIGEGKFAVVRECTHRAFQQKFALKIIQKNKCKGKEHVIDNEVSILRHVKHTNIIQLIEEYDTPDELYLVMEHVKGKNLFETIKHSTKYTERDASGMIYNLCSALKYLHGIHIVHRDIRPENLLVCDYEDGSKSLKLGDLGLAMVVREPLYVCCGTPTYMAPEVLTMSGYDTKVDIWAAGVITYILLCGYAPFISDKNEELFAKIMEGKLAFNSPYWDNISDWAKSLISLMIQTDPIRRLSAIEVMQHPWVSDDLAKDDNIQKSVASELGKNLASHSKPESRQTGIDLITATSLDKANRFLQGPRKAQLTAKKSTEYF